MTARFGRWRAREGLEIVPLLLLVPIVGGVGRGPVQLLPPEDVFAIVGV